MPSGRTAFGCVCTPGVYPFLGVRKCVALLKTKAEVRLWKWIQRFASTGVIRRPCRTGPRSPVGAEREAILVSFTARQPPCLVCFASRYSTEKRRAVAALFAATPSLSRRPSKKGEASLYWLLRQMAGYGTILAFSKGRCKPYAQSPREQDIVRELIGSVKPRKRADLPVPRAEAVW